jgi:hypothetical protein
MAMASIGFVMRRLLAEIVSGGTERHGILENVRCSGSFVSLDTQ